jgi:hypothetical protein
MTWRETLKGVVPRGRQLEGPKRFGGAEDILLSEPAGPALSGYGQLVDVDKNGPRSIPFI